MKPCDIFYGEAESDATSTTDEAVTETEAVEAAPEDGADVDALKTEESDIGNGSDDENSDDDQESLYIDLDGEEVSLDQVKEWKSEGLMQADYSRKTMALSDERKAFEAEKSEFASQTESIKQLTAELEAVIGSEDEVNMDELREDDPEAFIKRKELIEKREELLGKAKASLNATSPTSEADVAAERAALIEANPGWLDSEGKATDAYKADMTTLESYLSNNGWTNEEFSEVYQAKHVQALIKAAKYDALQGKKDAIAKKVKKAPVIKKGKSAANKGKSGDKSMTDIFYNK